MQIKKLKLTKGFKVAILRKSAEVAEMVIARGQSEGDSRNRHRGSDQWLFVLSGKGRATVNKRHYPLSKGTLLLIERNEIHEIKNTGTTPLKTINFYVPPAYRKSGDELPGRA